MIKSNAILEINKKNLLYNYKALSKLGKNSLTGATIKANAYGIGDIKVFNLLYKNKCRHFFFATVEEALKFSKIKKKSYIYVLNGLEKNNLNLFSKNNIIPILNSKEELDKIIKKNNKKINLQIGIQVETGLNRLGLNIEELKKINFQNLKIFILISHLASADELNNNYNLQQLKNFENVFSNFKFIKYKSLANSMGILHGKNFHYNITRPGIALYGGHYNSKLKKIIKSVVKLKAKILQVKFVKKNQYVGYNQTYKSKKNLKIAILGIGYGDGIPRIFYNKGFAMLKDESFKIIGKISMDSLTVDISKSKKKIKMGDYMEIINKKNDIEVIAKKCNTVSNEILTSITQRVKKIYI